jgi:hypothetical protein
VFWQALVFALACAGARNGVAWAEPAAAREPATAPSPAAKAEARERFDRGLRLFEKGENAGALAEFKRVNEIIPNPLVLYNMGLVYAAMNRPVEAVDTLGAFLAQSTSGQREQRKHATEIRDEQATRIARLVVNTQPPVTVEIDGIEVGTTPLVEPIRVASGAHVVGAQAPGFLPTRKEVTLAGQVTETLTLVLQPAATRMAQLVVTSSPVGAEVAVNGERVGVTPLPASVAVAPGSVRVEISRPGYLHVERTITLGDGAHGELAFTLNEDPSAPTSTKGALRILASEPDVDISIDGVPRGVGGAPVMLPAGPHELRVARAGFEPYQQTTSVTAGGDTPVVIDLNPTPETRARYEDSIKTRREVGWSILGAGAVVAIAGGVYALTKLGDVSNARDYLNNVVLANEADPQNECYAKGSLYSAHGCDAIKSDAQNRVDSAVLRRNLGFIGAGVGALAAGVGGYVLLSNGDPKRYRKTTGLAITDGALWIDGQHAELALIGRF